MTLPARYTQDIIQKGFEKKRKKDSKIRISFIDEGYIVDVIFFSTEKALSAKKISKNPRINKMCLLIFYNLFFFSEISKNILIKHHEC